jgi:hypothetical protein
MRKAQRPEPRSYQRAPEPCVDYPDLEVVGRAEGWYKESAPKPSITGENC